MRRFRNPRYAPEGLERKLNPSPIGIPVTAEVASMSISSCDPPPTVPTDPFDPATGTGSPPPTVPTNPNGPGCPD